jgi:hypothetical protein
MRVLGVPGSRPLAEGHDLGSSSYLRVTLGSAVRVAGDRPNPAWLRGLTTMELAGLEPATS